MPMMSTLALPNLAAKKTPTSQTTGNALLDNERTILILQKAIQLSPDDHADQPARYNGLGLSFEYRSKCTKSLADNNNALFNLQRAVQLTPEDHPDLPTWLDNLGSTLKARFDITSDPADLENAITNLQRAVQLIPEDHIILPSICHRLGTCFQERFGLGSYGSVEDVNRAIYNFQKAINHIPQDDNRLREWVHALGLSMKYRFICSSNLADADGAISNFQRAVDLSPDIQLGSLGYTGHLFHLASTWHHRYKCTQSPKDLAEAISNYESSATRISSYQGNQHEATRLHAAKNWALLCSLNNHPNRLKAFGVAIGLLSKVIDVSQPIFGRIMHLRSASEILSSATAAAIDTGEIVTALTWLEQGRCLVWNQIRQLRSPVEDLRMTNPSLADSFLDVSRALEIAGCQRKAINDSSDATVADMVAEHHERQRHLALTDQREKILSWIRAHPGFHDFLQPPKFFDLLTGLPEGPVIMFSIHETRCDAIALRSGEEPLYIPLGSFSFHQAVKLCESLRTYLRGKGVRMREAESRAIARKVDEQEKPIIYQVLRELWENVVKPILKALGYSLASPPERSHRPRVWWCPIGPLSFLPIHAAGICHEKTCGAGPRVSDFVISSYIPTLSALLDQTRMKLAPSADRKPPISKLLLISQPFTPGQSPIPATQRETQVLKDIVGGVHNIEALLLEGNAANLESVAKAMNTHNWVHFACHAVQDKEDPLKSGVQLHNGRLELLEMMKLRVGNAEHAFLSACQTSTGDETLSDEAVHLAAGLLAAGYRGVVSTMWSIQDRHGPDIAKGFYQDLLKGELAKEREDRRLESRRAAGALDEAIREIREKLGDSEEALLTWVPYVHFGI